MALVNAPEDFERELQPIPEDVQLVSAAVYPCDVILAFFTESAPLRSSVADLAQALRPAGGLWLAWPKKSSGICSDVTEVLVREIGLQSGLVDNKVCAVTEVWSALRFVFRVKGRPPATRI